MPPVSSIGRTETAVLWTTKGFDTLGQFTLDSPVEIPVRWEEGQREATDPEGNRIGIQARVFPDRKLKIGSVLYRGTMSDWNRERAKGAEMPYMRVVTSGEVPDVKGRETEYQCGLQRYRGSL